MGDLGQQLGPVVGLAEQIAPLLKPRDDPSPNQVFYGTVLLPGWTRRESAFVKIFPHQVRPQLVFNEVIAHLIAIQLELPSPLTFPCACRTSLLKGGGGNSDGEFVLGVASIDGRPKRFKQVIRSSDCKWEDIMNWPYAAHIAVFDELICNDDRHIGNLVRCGEHDYMAIDHERILRGEPWFTAELDAVSPCDANGLASTIAEGTDQVMRQRMIQIASRYVLSHLLYTPELAGPLEAICGAPHGSTDKLVTMLNARRVALPRLMQWHTQKGELFRASTFR